MINEVIEILENNNLHSDLIESIRNTLVEHAKNERRCFFAGKPFSQKKLNNTTPGVERERNHKSLVNSDQIVIQIPKDLKVSSILIEFHPKTPEHPVRSLMSTF